MIRTGYMAMIFLMACCVGLSLLAQQVLPHISAKETDEGIEVQWNSQYNGVKLITVMRSDDSIHFEAIGTISKPIKGVQSFTDDDPDTGRNYYELQLTFSSGLDWKTDICSIYIFDDNSTGTTLITASIPAAKKTDSLSRPTEQNYPAGSREAIASWPPKRFVLSPFLSEDLDPPVYIHSRHVYVSAATGDIELDMPDDCDRHQYSLRFYDDRGHLDTEIPAVHPGHIILDKRNFQRKGIYHFVLKRDIIEVDDGFVLIDP